MPSHAVRLLKALIVHLLEALVVQLLASLLEHVLEALVVQLLAEVAPALAEQRWTQDTADNLGQVRRFRCGSNPFTARQGRIM